MKTATFGLDIAPGKIKYNCPWFAELVKKFAPQKESPYVMEFIGEDPDKADAVVFDANKKLDFVLVDLEKVEKRLARAVDEKEKTLLASITKILESETLLCDRQFTQEEQEILKQLQFVTYKPCLGIQPGESTDKIIRQVLDKSGTLLFYTAGKKEVHVWDMKKGDSVVVAAGRIHSDLARGFIRAEIVSCRDLDKFFNLAEAKSRGLTKTVDRAYIMEEGDIIDVKFSV